MLTKLISAMGSLRPSDVTRYVRELPFFKPRVRHFGRAPSCLFFFKNREVTALREAGRVFVQPQDPLGLWVPVLRPAGPRGTQRAARRA